MIRIRSLHFKLYPLTQLLLGGSHFRHPALHLNSIFSAKKRTQGKTLKETLQLEVFHIFYFYLVSCNMDTFTHV